MPKHCRAAHSGSGQEMDLTHPSGLLQRLEPSGAGSDDRVGIGAPDEGFGLCGVVFGDEPVDRGLQVDDGVEDAVLQPAPGPLGEEALYGVQPRAPGTSRRPRAPPHGPAARHRGRRYRPASRRRPGPSRA